MVDNLARFERMAQRTRERTSAAALRCREEAVQWARDNGGAPEQFDGEGPLLDYDNWHAGHRTHINFLHHGNGVMCSCGQVVGCFSFVMPSEDEMAAMTVADIGYCPVCRARGIEHPTDQ